MTLAKDTVKSVMLCSACLRLTYAVQFEEEQEGLFVYVKEVKLSSLTIYINYMIFIATSSGSQKKCWDKFAQPCALVIYSQAKDRQSSTVQSEKSFCSGTNIMLEI